MTPHLSQFHPNPSRHCLPPSSSSSPATLLKELSNFLSSEEFERNWIVSTISLVFITAFLLVWLLIFFCHIQGKETTRKTKRVILYYSIFILIFVVSGMIWFFQNSTMNGRFVGVYNALSGHNLNEQAPESTLVLEGPNQCSDFATGRYLNGIMQLYFQVFKSNRLFSFLFLIF